MHQHQLDNATTTTQQMQQQRLNKCNKNVIMHVSTNRATAPFAKFVIRLDKLQPPSLKKHQSYSSLR